ncbi:MAG: T9SS type A sorting domain-containing protein, partial [Bacteroidales bacterium]|nr:T9SS type A sorting domain-containing protein [Bacteroidales bacterium]
PSTENGFLTEAYDLYEFDQSADNEWVNYEQHGFDIVSGKGYLYASQASTTLTFEGQPYNGNGKIDLVYDENANLAGWNLIGNPFGVTASIGRDFYVMNPAGSEIVLAETDQIEAMQGVFVIAEHDGETVTFTPGASTDDGNKLVINVAQNRSSVIDRAIVRFGQGNQLPKFMLNDNNTKLYIPQADNDYAVVRSDDEAELPLNFKAAANGTYILKVDANSTELDYLHLIDNKTGNDIDLLENPSYTFEANATDFANRFKLVLRNTTSIDENTNFAFYNGLDWTVNNEGKSTLQVVDMTGRIVSTETIDGTAHVTINAAPGAYMLQLTNGNDVKTQKIIIK